MNERDRLKAEMGLEVVAKKVALSAAIDPFNQHYLASCVYAVVVILVQ